MVESTIKINGWERALMAAEKVKERLRRATRALDDAGVPYAVVGGNAVAEWVARIDEGAIRNTRDVDLLIQRADLGAARTALEATGFIYYQLLDVDMFIDGPQGRPSEAIHLLYAGEKVRRDDEHALPNLDESERAAEFQVTSLEALLRMKLIAWRDKDRTHLRDLLGMGLIDESWYSRLCPEHAERLQHLIDNPDG